MRWFKRLVAVAVLSMSTALAGVGASYGQDKVVRIGFQKYGKLVLLKGKGTLEGQTEAARLHGRVDRVPVRPAVARSAQCRCHRFRRRRRSAADLRAGRRRAASSTSPTSRRRRRAKRSWSRRTAPLKSVADLKGKKVALNKGSNVHYLLVQGAGEGRPEIHRHRAGVSGAGRRARRVRARRRRCLGDLGSLPGGRAKPSTGARILADGTGLVANHQFYLAVEEVL